MKLLGGRVAVNARQANLMVQVVARPGNNSSPSSVTGSVAGSTATNLGGTGAPLAGLHLFAWHYETVCPRAELDAMAGHLQLQESAEGAQGVNDLETLYAQERRFIEDRRVLPLVLLPEFAGIGGNVRNWMPARWGEWRLADVWLENDENTPNVPPTSNSAPEKITGRRP